MMMMTTTKNALGVVLVAVAAALLARRAVTGKGEVGAAALLGILGASVLMIDLQPDLTASPSLLSLPASDQP